MESKKNGKGPVETSRWDVCVLSLRASRWGICVLSLRHSRRFSSGIYLGRNAKGYGREGETKKQD